MNAARLMVMRFITQDAAKLSWFICHTLATVLLDSSEQRVASERGRKSTHRDGRDDLVLLQNFFRCHAFAIHIAHVIVVRLDDHALEFESGKQPLAARVGEDLGAELQIGRTSDLPTASPATTEASAPSMNSSDIG